MEEVLRRASVAAELAIDRIQALGLRVAVEKTEAIVFGGRGWRLPRGLAKAKAKGQGQHQVSWPTLRAVLELLIIISILNVFKVYLIRLGALFQVLHLNC